MFCFCVAIAGERGASAVVDEALDSGAGGGERDEGGGQCEGLDCVQWYSGCGGEDLCE